MRLSAHAERAAQAAGAHAAKVGTARFQQEAADAGWPAEHVKNLRVTHKDGIFSTHLAGAEDLEYGTLTDPPLPVARPFESRIDHTVGDEYDRVLEQHLRGIL